MKRIPGLVAVLVLTLGITTSGPLVRTYDTSAQTRMHASIPYTGVLQLTIQPSGIINGRYTGNSIRPDPFFGKVMTVTGGTEKGSKKFWLSCGNGMRVSGEFTRGGFDASGWDRRHRLWDIHGALRR